jgi:hypothetical protein
VAVRFGRSLTYAIFYTLLSIRLYHKNARKLSKDRANLPQIGNITLLWTQNGATGQPYRVGQPIVQHGHRKSIGVQRCNEPRNILPIVPHYVQPALSYYL